MSFKFLHPVKKASYYLNFRDEETGTEKGYKLSKVTQMNKGGAGI